jgi:hypothetical protein
MPVLPEDRVEYVKFVDEQTKILGSLGFAPEQTLWHYTNGAGLLGIIESGTLHATQVACLNDSSEIRYASKLLLDALSAIGSRCNADDDVKQLLTRMRSGPPCQH